MFAEIITISLAVAHPGGDCFANRANGDTWHVGNEWFCGVVPSTAQEIKQVKVNNQVIEPAQPVITVDEKVTLDEPKPSDSVSSAVPTNGNPGNLKPVGNAGENPNGQGTMPQDNAGGNGNGQHGNQGVNRP